MTNTRVPQPSLKRTTRHHRCDEAFIALLEEDFPEIPRVAFEAAFHGFPAAPKKQAIHVCEWASRTDNPGRALMAWARKRGEGVFRPDPSDA